MNIDMEKLVPRFLMDQPTTHGLANAIGAALQALWDGVEAGIAAVTDVEEMPEWRLDEMAWETGCLYDYMADVEAKRAWIRDAAGNAACQGTAEAIRRYLQGMFEDSDVEEAADYGGEPFHFRVLLNGRWDEASMAWAVKAAQAGKNLRSVLDGFVEQFEGEIQVGAERINAGAGTRIWASESTMCGA